MKLTAEELAVIAYNEELEAAFNKVVKALNFYYQRESMGLNPTANLAVFEDGSWAIGDWEVPSDTVCRGFDATSFVNKIGGRSGRQ